MPASMPDLSTGGVRTLLLVPSCPICGVPLQGKQTVCSAKCRAARSRRRRERVTRERDQRVRLFLRTALDALHEARELLADSPKNPLDRL
jgi:predicted nucleic acid-binding Zn ribbon protein